MEDNFCIKIALVESYLISHVLICFTESIALFLDSESYVPSKIEQSTTAFISNLNFKVDEDYLREFFQKVNYNIVI